MKYYFKNILRNILKNKASYLGAISVIALGILIYIAMSDVLLNLKSKSNQYYNEFHFAQVFATVTQMPSNKLEDLKDIEGIDEVFGRLSADTRLLIEGQNNIVTLHLLAYDEKDVLNQLKLTPSSLSIDSDALFLGSKMNQFYHFDPGSTLSLVVGNTTKSFTLAGTLQAPEYIYSVPPSGVQMPDNEIYDIACISKAALEDLLNKQNIVTELGFTLKSGYNFESIKYELEQRLVDYGLISLTKREDQLSNSMISEEFSQLTAMATILPFIFLVISIFMLYIILKKMISGDRSLIGTLKAFGFTDGEILRMYLCQSVIIGILGSILGSCLSIILGKYMFSLYSEMYNLPYTHYDCFRVNQMVGLILAVSTSLLATYLGVKDVLHIHPAESMRAAAPPIGKLVSLPNFINRRLNSRQKMGVRAIFRNKFRSLVIALAITFPFAFISVLNTFGAACEELFYSQFTKIQTYDLKIALTDYVKYNDALSSAHQIEGAYNVDVVAEYTPLFTFENRSEFSSLTALSPDSPVWHIMDYKETYYSPSDSGIIINSTLANKLGLNIGDVLEITSAYLAPEPVKIPVVQIVSESLGGGCYISIHALQKYFNITPMANSILLNCDIQDINSIKATLSKTYNVSSVTDTARALKSYKEMMKSMIQMVNIFAYFSILTGIILIYNISNISLRERKNEFGTLTILGATPKELREIITFEQLINFVLGILIGFPATFALKKIVMVAIFSDSYTLELKILPKDYFYAFIICLAIMLVSLKIIMNHIKKMELTDVLKERE